MTSPNKHPKGLAILFFTEMWERFSFYGMKALLVFYLIKYHFFSDDTAAEYVGNYAALVYALPVLGGYLADRFLGMRKAVFYGAVLLILGHLGMAFEGSQAFLDGENIVRDEKALSVFFLSLGLIIMGVGFLKPNISTMVGRLYPENDPRRDSGFTIFYMGINLGAFIATIICPWLAEKYGWKYGFGAAGIGMVFGLITFHLGKGWLKGVGEPPSVERLKEKVFLGLNREVIIYILGILLVFVNWQLVRHHTVVGNLLMLTAGAFLVYIGWYMAKKANRATKQQLVVLLVLFVSATVFFAFLEQQYISLNLFADRMVDRNIFGIDVKAGQFLSLNALFIIMFGPVVAALWIRLSRAKKEPNVPVKFGLGIIFAAISFAFLIFGLKVAGVEGKVNATWLVLSYLFVTLGELALSPVGLSSVTKLSPKEIVSFMMGGWFLASAASEYLAAVFSKLASTETIGGEVVNKLELFNNFNHLFYVMLYIGLGFGVVLLIFSPILKKWMHGIK